MIFEIIIHGNVVFTVSLVPFFNLISFALANFDSNSLTDVQNVSIDVAKLCEKNIKFYVNIKLVDGL